MKQPISNRDLEQLSAYLDGALPPRVRAQLDQRLKAEPHLASALEQLRQTRALLRRAPQRRVPRSFTLTRQMLAEAPRARAGGWNSFSLVSAAASLLLVLVLIGDLSVNGLPQISFGAASAPVADEAPEALMAQEPTATGEEAIETLTLPEDMSGADRQVKEEESRLDLRSFFARSARPIELALVLIIILGVLGAWLQRRRS